ncbi:3-hydroxybutyryl-CoA dehydrogenase [Actinoplanes derwentensis]|uniref:3-hydroxybutyryl-CoA dehydrogenase n=1 Tax=Actinoplanes derwentensis TaxID=113562 RepID=A0A1H1Y7H5_9ACTN|nr:3-hydroxybutyryl-CoA dehydrogenase [Actinoplanes derwentensis]GID86691.1 3-hydroxybutyryl-CoA dehydrogenase [Actinoplanes derwentensis]SDT17413.1 3-hydroxybutyryl-CoA dehydrogenase [Actinoplanes derwentensis]
MNSTITRVGIVGCGTMGAGLAELCARAGLDVRVAVSSADSMTRGRDRISRSLDRAVTRGKISADDRERALGAVSFTGTLTGLADRQLVIESVPEDEKLKRDVFTALDAAIEDPDAILASNTSSFRITQLAGYTGQPWRVIGTHFFNPVQVLPLVEVVPTAQTAPHVTAGAEAFAVEVLGKQPIRSADRGGFVVNALLIPYLLGAIRMVETGHASAADIDRGMRLGCSHPLGPLELTDLIGLDVIASVAGALHAEFGDPIYAPPALLRTLVAEGRLGRKTGGGFFPNP